MHTRTILLIGIVLAAASAPIAGAGHPNTNCNPNDPRHSFSGTYGVSVGVFNPITGQHETYGAAVTVDLCMFGARDASSSGALGPIEFFDGDGEAEFGVGGARFPAGTGPCEDNEHHSYGPGAQYWADETFGFNVIYSVGADGPALVQDPTEPIPCGTDGIISNDPLTDPLDCGAGDNGIYAPGFLWLPATLAETVGGNGACDPFDSTVWGFLPTGVTDELGTLIASTPTDGHFWG